MRRNSSEDTASTEYEVDIPAPKLREHIEKLVHKLDPNDPIFNGFEEEFNASRF